MRISPCPVRPAGQIFFVCRTQRRYGFRAEAVRHCPKSSAFPGEAARAAIATADACTRSRYENRKVDLSEIIGK